MDHVHVRIVVVHNIINIVFDFIFKSRKSVCVYFISNVCTIYGTIKFTCISNQFS